jgi:hypothetical protein
VSSWLSNSFKFGHNANTAAWDVLAPGLGTSKYNPLYKAGAKGTAYEQKENAPPGAPLPPPVPNPNDAANAAQATADQLRARRGLLSTIYAGAGNTQPVTGKTQLGT